MCLKIGGLALFSVSRRWINSFKFICLLSVFVFTQNLKVSAEEVEETSQTIITSILSQNISDDEKVVALYYKAYDVMLDDKYIAEELGKYLISFSSEHDVVMGTVYGYTVLGTIYRANTLYDKAKLMQTKCIEVLEKHDTERAFFASKQIRFEIGVIESELSNYEKADSIYTSLLPYFNEKNIDQLSLAYLELSNVRLQQRNYASFDTLIDQTLLYAKKSDLSFRVTSTLESLAVSYTQRKEYEKAQSILKNIINDYPDAPSSDRSSWHYSLGVVQCSLNENELARENLQVAFDGFVEAGYYNKNVDILSKLAELAINSNELPSALRYINQSESYAAQSKDVFELSTISYLKALYDFRIENYKRAKQHLTSALQTTASFNSNDVIQQTKLLGLILEAEGHDKLATRAFELSDDFDSRFVQKYPFVVDFSEIEPLLEKQFNPILSLVFGGLVVITPVFLGLRRKKNQSKINKVSPIPVEDPLKLSIDETNKVIELIQKRIVEEKAFTDSDFNQTEASELVGVSSRELSKLLKQAYGMSYVQFIKKNRIELVMTLLEEDNSLKIQDLCNETGINNRTTFTDMFKSHTGTTLSEYKKQNATAKI